MTPHHVELWTMRATIAGAVFQLATAIVAAAAAGTWRSTLKRQRRDDCIIAVRDFRARVGRTVSLHEKGLEQPAVWAAYNESWASWSAFTAAAEVAGSYYPKLKPEEMESNGPEILEALATYARTAKGTEPPATINKDAQSLVETVRTRLGK